MARKPSKTPALTPHEKRLRNTDRKLREALERLVKGLPTHPDLQKRSYRLTIATLAREARVGRNAIYTNHRSMIDELRRASDRKIVPEKLAAWETQTRPAARSDPGLADRGAAYGDGKCRPAEAHPRSRNGG
ncbi:hypothetical protein [Sinorhizobium psoraleae]|nr:hypothetical protein [Sinorhizobium psoraleae]